MQINNKLISDTGWTTLTLSSSFKPYNNDNTQIPRCRKKGNIVEIRGCITPTKEIAANQSTTILTIPVGFRPTECNAVVVCQGSGMNRWTCIAEIGGILKIERYGITTNGTIPAGAWMPFTITYFTN